MELSLAERLASSIDPKGLTSLQNRNSDPAVGHAVAEQFGAYLMQGLMRQSDGQALAMAEGTGSGAVNAMFADGLSRVAMSGDKLGLADMIYKSIAAKQDAAAPAPVSGDEPKTAAASATSAPPPAHGFSLSPYRQNNGARPVGPPLGRLSMPGVNAQDAALPAKAAINGVPADTSSAPAKRPALPAVTRPAAQSPAPAASSAQAASVTVPSTSAWIRIFEASGPTAAPSSSPISATPADTAPLPAATTSPTDTAAPGVSSGSSTYGLPWAHGQSNGNASPAPSTMDGDHAANQPALSKDAESFAKSLAPALQQAAARLGVSPKTLLAQAALETGWGRSVVGNNVFGVKATSSWSGPSVTAATREMVGSHMITRNSQFRSYPSVASAVEDYVTLLSTNGRYRAALGTGDDVAAYARGIDAGGYATDKDYAAKLIAVTNSPQTASATATLEPQAPDRLAFAEAPRG